MPMTLETLHERYERLLERQQAHYSRIITRMEQEHTAEMAEALDVLSAVVDLFTRLDMRDMVTLTTVEQQHMALILSEARRYLDDVAKEPQA